MASTYVPKVGGLMALGMGCVIAWIDTRPGWDDTGITAGALLVAAAAAALGGVRWWRAAALVATPLLAVEVRSAGWAIFLAGLFAIAGALGGALLRRVAASP